MKKSVFIIFLFLSITVGFAQSVSKIIDEADKKSKNNECEEAVKLYSKALELKSSSKDAYLGRYNCYIKLGYFDKAIDDAKFLINLSPKNPDYKFMLAEVNYKLGNYVPAAELLAHLIIDYDKKFEYYNLIILSKINAKENEAAILYCNEAAAAHNQHHHFFYLRGIAQDSTRNFQLSTLSYKKAIEIIESDKKLKSRLPYIDYYLNLGKAFAKLQRWGDAVLAFNGARMIDDKRSSTYILLGDAYTYGAKYKDALESYNIALNLGYSEKEINLKKAIVLKKQKKFIEAISEFNKIIESDTLNIDARIEKAICLEELTEFNKALAVYDEIKKINNNEPRLKTLLENNKRISYNYYKETEKPDIKILNPETDDFNLLIDVGKTYLDISAQVFDKSRISSIFIEDDKIEVDENILNPKISHTLSIDGKNQIVFRITDIYYNTATFTYSIKRSEKNPPSIIISEPLAGVSNNIFIPNELGNEIIIKGIIDDESQINSIIINGISASYTLNEINPKFEVSINIEKTDSIKCIVTDAFGNTQEKSFSINRKSNDKAMQNPMGITWVVFIENSNYANYSSLDGPKKDLAKIKKSLVPYKIDNFIVKSDLTKEQMEKFFAIELRNLLKVSQVNSLIIWYAGHGKYINENGYWIPVNASRTDEYSYFQITNLKGYISTYNFLKHVLVISDACETGPAFCENSIKNLKDPGDCSKSQAIEKRSAQVFTSSNTESSADESIFADSFANVLSGNSEKCLSIERLVKKVQESVQKIQNQKPTFGIIPGITLEKGSFYFMRK